METLENAVQAATASAEEAESKLSQTLAELNSVKEQNDSLGVDLQNKDDQLTTLVADWEFRVAELQFGQEASQKALAEAQSQLEEEKTTSRALLGAERLRYEAIVKEQVQVRISHLFSATLLTFFKALARLKEESDVTTAAAVSQLQEEKANAQEELVAEASRRESLVRAHEEVGFSRSVHYCVANFAFRP